MVSSKELLQGNFMMRQIITTSLKIIIVFCTVSCDLKNVTQKKLKISCLHCNGNLFCHSVTKAVGVRQSHTQEPSWEQAVPMCAES